MIYRIEKFCDGYKCIVSNTLVPELVFYARTRSTVIKMATRFVFKKTYKEVCEQIEIQERDNKGYSF